MIKVFIDGSAGTTGLRIAERLGARQDIDLLKLPEEQRKLPEARKAALAEADLAFLCLPDAAAKEAAEWAEAENTALIDTSTAHRTAEGWLYGFPELFGTREILPGAKRVANPGCHASGFVALIAPLTEAGVLPADAELSAFSITGYSGGGKKMIAEYEDAELDPLFQAPRQYGLSQQHKHLPEMQHYCKLQKAPVFLPVVAPFYAGMEVSVPLHRDMLNGGIGAVKAVYREQYRGSVVRFAEEAGENGFLSACAFEGSDGMEISVQGNEERIVLTARFDNLGKGASGAAIQNMNLMLGFPETEGLVL